jgi:hypothetical protein
MAGTGHEVSHVESALQAAGGPFVAVAVLAPKLDIEGVGERA